MDTELGPPEPLQYAVTDAGLVEAPWRQKIRFPKISVVFIVVIGMVAIHLLYIAVPSVFERFFGDHLRSLTIVSCFIPILVKKRGLRRFAISVAAGAIFLIASRYLYEIPLDWAAKVVGLHVALSFAVIACWASPLRQTTLPGFLSRAILLTFAIGGFTETVYDFNWAAAVESRFPYTIDFLPSYLFVLLLWLGIAWMERTSASSAFRKLDRIAIACISLLLLTASTYFGFFQTAIASHSILTGRPFDRLYSLQILVHKHATDSQLWELLEHSNWNQIQLSENSGTDWRKTAIEFLATRDTTTADRLSKMLLLHPTSFLADVSAKELADANRFECLPVFLRFALFNHSWSCTDAAVKLDAPQAAWPLLLNYVGFARSIGDPRPSLGTSIGGMSIRTQLAALLGGDCGTDPDAWSDLLTQRAHGHRLPIPDPIADEADHVIDLYLRYSDASYRLMQSKVIPAPDIKRPAADVPDLATLEQVVDQFVKKVDSFASATHPAPQKP